MRTVSFQAGQVRFEWDSEKARMNLTKHGVSFLEAATAFADGLSLVIPDPEHSEDENRFLLIGGRLRADY